ncbi:MAG: hypothetical protein ACT4OV_05550 [Microthrixaceae bacterium]
MTGRKIIVFGTTVMAGVVLASGVAGAQQCTNANKPPGAGAQVVIDGNTDQVVFATKGLTNRFERGLIGPDGEGFHGLVGIDLNGDGKADLMTYIVGPNSEIPTQAQQNGSPDHGIVNICGGTCG